MINPGQMLSMKLTTMQWHIIDGTMDNEISTEVVEGDPKGVVKAADRIREAGWEQVAHWTPGVPGSGSWPPSDQEVTVTLSAGDWALVLTTLELWEAVPQSTGDDDADAASQAVRDAIATQMGEQGYA